MGVKAPVDSLAIVTITDMFTAAPIAHLKAMLGNFPIVMGVLNGNVQAPAAVIVMPPFHILDANVKVTIVAVANHIAVELTINRQL